MRTPGAGARPRLLRRPPSFQDRAASLGSVFDPRRNSLNAIRLLLAALVIVSHAWPLGRYGSDPSFGDQNLGGWAVAGFFTVSGFLITMSGERSRTVWDYLWRRVLRIYPGFVVALVIGGFVLAPVASLLGGGRYSLAGAGQYVVRNLGLFIVSYRPTGMFDDAPFNKSLNGALWTLFFEFLCYLAVAVVIAFLPRRARPPVILGIFVAGTVIMLAVTFTDLTLSERALRLARLGTYFAAGAVLHQFRDRVPFSPLLTAVAAGLTVATAFTGTSQALAGLPVAYLLLSGSMLLPLSGIGARNDISYGLYIYGFPVEQTLTLLLLRLHLTVPVGAYVVLALAAALPFAWASWLLVERPAMRWKSLTAGRPIDREGHVQQR